MTLTTTLAEYFTALRYETLPPILIEKAKENLIDTLAGAIPGAQAPDVKGITEALGAYDAQADCVLWGTTRKASAPTAALVNGTAGHALEMDDFHPEGKCHMGVVVIPAVLALGEKHGISGKELIAAIIAGYEVGLRIAIGAGTASHRLRGWHATSTCGVFGAAAASAKMLRLSPRQTVNALGLAGTQAGGLWAFMQDGAGNKKFHGGSAARGGVTAAILASGGMTGPAYILEAADGGFLPATSDAYDVNAVIEGLGETWRVLRVGRKPYACCRSMHLSIDGVFELKKKHGLAMEDIASIDVETYEIGVKQCGTFQVPNNTFEATFSTPYGIAVAFKDDAAGTAQFTKTRVQDPELLDLCSRITVRASEKYSAAYPQNWGCEMTVRTRDGRVLKQEIWNGKGGPDNPMSREDLILKFRSLAGAVLPDARMDAILAAIDDLENCRDVANLTALLVA
jgi:2-methylcitrate dehydratase PrpD